MLEQYSFEVEVDEEVIRGFAELSGDHNPLHIDAEYASRTEFTRPIAHGAYLLGLVSRMVGMHIPGRRCLVLSVRSKFPKPLYYPAKVRIEGSLKGFDEQRSIGITRVIAIEMESEDTVLEAEVNFALHTTFGSDTPAAEQDGPALFEVAAETEKPREGVSGQRLLVTGGTGGLGTEIVEALAERYDLLCLTRKSSLPERRGVEYERLDLEDGVAVDGFLGRLSPEDFYGIVHMSTPPVKRGFTSDSLADVRRHWRHAVEIPVLLANWAKGADSGVRRLVLMGSIFGNKRPNPQLGAYSLAKSGTENLASLLSWDLAQKGVTVNVVSPGIVPLGLNKGMLEREQQSLASQTATGRLCSARDLAGLIQFLLSDGAGQINGTVLTVDGGY
jgi:3-oxoacyl-[acyl-carrier protein] reductase